MAPAGGEPEQQWPPRSPHEALLSTPKGRERYREILNRTSPSPSPRRGPRFNTNSSVPASLSLGIQGTSDAEDDEDEETLQLKLQEIQAKLKLKKLQKNARAKSEAGSSVAASTDPFSPSRAEHRLNPKSPRRNDSNIQVPASPIRKLQTSQPQKSPSRVLLGIDKGLTAKDVSLKRAPSHRRLNSALSSKSGSCSLAASSLDAPKVSSFSERLAGLRSDEVSREERQARIQSVRSNAFGIGKDEMENYKKNAVEIPSVPLAPPTFTRDEILGSSKSTRESLIRSRATPTESASGSGASITKNEAAASSSFSSTTEPGQAYEPYSSFHLTRRDLPHNVLTRNVTGKKSYGLKDLLRDVKGPDFSLPDIEQDVVVFAILAKKSEPRSHKTGAGSKAKVDEDRGRYMVMTLTDLDFELDLFLFNTGFERFWKLTEGTVVAILNPTIMPPPPGRHDTGRFSLVVNSDEDTVLEIGIARDLGFCKSIKKDGNPCGSWVNKKRTEFCEFHSNEAVRKQKSTRIEMNSGSFGGQNVWGRGGLWQQKKKTNTNFDRETHTHWFAARSMSASDLIDGKDMSLEDRKERAKFLKKNLGDKEKEREMMKKLGKIGSAAGREYMKLSGSTTAASGSQPRTTGSGSGSGGRASASRYAENMGAAAAAAESSTDAAATLNLVRSGAGRPVHLSPVKRKRNGSSQSSVVTTASSASRSSSAVGWGSDLREKLLSMKTAATAKPTAATALVSGTGEAAATAATAKKSRSPVRKKTRFVTDRGIREAGRESLGLDVSSRQVNLGDDEEEELVIIG